MFRRLAPSLVLVVLLSTAEAAPLGPGHSRAVAQVAGTSSDAPAWLDGWPMDGHDPQRTSRSPGIGPVQMRLTAAVNGVYASVAGPESELYGCTSSTSADDGKLVALDTSGKTLWSYPACLGPAAVAPNGNVLVVGSSPGPSTSANTIAAALASGGTLVWKIQPFGLLKGTEPLVTAKDLFYVPVIGPHELTGSDPYIGLNIISPQGAVLRRLKAMDSLALGQDGTIYAVSPGRMEALDPQGRLLWQHGFKGQHLAGPMVAKDGTIYVSYSQTLAAYAPSGRLVWKLRWHDGPLALAERSDGTILVAGRNQLGAVNPGGRRLWHVTIGHSAGQFIPPSLIVDAAGTAYVGSGDGKVRVISGTGKIRARLFAGGPKLASVPAIMLLASGRLIISGTDGVLRVYQRR
jgi:outer membrane protein assembly factor BamB